MNKIFTLISAGLLCLCTPYGLNAQFSQDFESMAATTGNCWIVEGFFQTTNPAEVITGSGSFYTNPPTNNNGSGTRDLYTPYLTVIDGSVTLSFNYKLSGDLSKNAKRQIEVGLLEKNGLFTSLETIAVKGDQVTTKSYEGTFKISTIEVSRIVLKFSGGQGDGNSRIIVDDFYTDATPHYGPETHCNRPPAAVADTYTAISYSPYMGSSVLTNDNDPDNENLSISLASPSPDGKVILNEDGTFAFIPNADFAGTSTTFTYSITDDGYEPMTSTATVTINFYKGSVLPVKLMHFSGAMDETNARLQWIIADNEKVKQVDVERSTNGKDFSLSGVVFATDKTGAMHYEFAESAKSEKTYYRIKIRDTKGKITYSNVIILAAQEAYPASTLKIINNPFADQLSFIYTAQSSGPIVINLYNAAGLLVYSHKENCFAGINQFTIPGRYTAARTHYLVEVINAGKERRVAKAIKL